MSSEKKISRRQVLALTGAAAAAVVLGGAYYLGTQGPPSPTSMTTQTPTQSETQTQTQPTTPAGPSPVTLGYLNYTGGPEEPVYKALLREYEKETGYATVKDEYVEWNDLHDKQALAFAASASDYDLVYTYSPWLAEFGFAGYYEPLDQYLAEDFTSNFVPGVLDGGKVNGKTMMLTTQPMTLVLYYRPDLFKQAGIGPPTNWAEIVEAGKKIQTKTGGKVNGIVFSLIKGIGYSNWGAMINGAGAKIFDENLKPAMNTSNGLAAIQYIYDLIYTHKIMPKVTTTWGSSSFSNKYFSDGKAAMVLEWAPNWAAYKDALGEWHDKFDATILPAKDGGGASVMEPNGHAIPVFSRYKGEAWKLLRWTCTGYERQKSMWEAGVNVYSNRQLFDEKKAGDPSLQVVEEQLTAGPTNDWAKHPQIAKVRDICTTELQACLLEQKTPQEALAAMESRMLALSS